MRTVALVPFKSFSYAKKRLRGSYSDADVEAIGRAMLEDVLAALTSTPGLEAVWVLTDDPEVARLAEGCGAEARVRRPDPGLNRAIDEANGEAEAFDATLVVLGDTPLLRGEDVEAVLRAGAEGSVVLVPSPDGGTIMLLRRPPHRIAARFGSGSFRKHVEACREQGFEPLVLDAIPETFRTDLDTPEDAAHILGAGISGRTVEVLRKLHDR
jgi:2-phospho-L-lactate guanylyltransferase